MAACWRLGAVLQTFQKCGCLPLTSLRQFSILATVQQGRLERLLAQSQLTCVVKIPNRQEVRFTTKRRRFKPCHEKDGVGSNMALVYENSMHRYHFWGQLVVNTLAVPIYGMSTYIILSTWHLQDFSITSGFMTACAYIVMYTFLVAGVNSLCGRSICRMYCDASATNFAAVVQDWKMMPKTIHFDLSTVRRKPPGDVFGSFFGNLIIDGRSYLVMPNDFVVPKFYNMLLGYNLKRPIDLDLIKDIDIKTMLGKQPKSKTPPKGSR